MGFGFGQAAEFSFRVIGLSRPFLLASGASCFLRVAFSVSLRVSVPFAASQATPAPHLWGTKACDILSSPKRLKDSRPEGLAGQFWLRICRRLQSSYQLGRCQMACLGGQNPVKLSAGRLPDVLPGGTGSASKIIPWPGGWGRAPHFPDCPVAVVAVGGGGPPCLPMGPGHRAAQSGASPEPGGREQRGESGPRWKAQSLDHFVSRRHSLTSSLFSWVTDINPGTVLEAVKTPARASGVSFLENEMALRSVLVPEPGCQGGRAPGPMQAPQEEACPLPEHGWRVLAPGPGRAGPVCMRAERGSLSLRGCRQSTQKAGERKKMSDTGPGWPMKPGVCSLLLQGGRRLVAVPASRAARGIGTGSSFSSRQPLPAPC